MNITKHTTFAFTMAEVKQSLLDYQKDVMAEILMERLNLSHSPITLRGSIESTVTGLELLNWSMLLLNGTHTEEFKNLEKGRWINTPSFTSGYIKLFGAYPHVFMDTVELIGLNENDCAFKFVYADGSEVMLDPKVILSNI
jgi:hypothetical protein